MKQFKSLQPVEQQFIRANSNSRLTDEQFWHDSYVTRVLEPFRCDDWRNYIGIQLVGKLEELHLDEKNICEVGGGDAKLLAFLARRYPTSSFAVIDFSPLGCKLARQRADIENVLLHVYQEDVFTSSPSLVKSFDIVVSHGVVEHFTDLASILRAKKVLLKDDGRMFTLIPNFSSPILGYLCRRWSTAVYDRHVLHDMGSFVAGHEEAGLSVMEKGYLGATEFGMLSMAVADMDRSRRLEHLLYLWLTRLSKLVHWFEYRTMDFPVSRMFSPFIYVISKPA